MSTRLSKELDGAAERIKAWTQDDTGLENIGVLVRSGKQVDLVVSELLERGGRHRTYCGDEVAHPGEPVVMTMHRAKGMEFSRVILFGIGESDMPIRWALKDLGEPEKADGLLLERSLLLCSRDSGT